MESFYLGPTRRLVDLSTWTLVQSAAAGGVLDETHWVELKELVAPSNRVTNLELACDLASLAVDGGIFVVGIQDARGRAGAVVGTALAGLADRITQVAQGRVTPPLSITTAEVPDPDHDGIGVLIVSVPVSLDAPHMADERYWGRSNVGKRALSDPEVRRLWDERGARRQGFTDRLHEMEAPDHQFVAESHRVGVNVCILFEPTATPPSEIRVSEELGFDFAPESTLSAILGYAPRAVTLSSLLVKPDQAGLVLTTVRDDGLVLGNGPARLLLGDDGTVAFWAGDQSIESSTLGRNQRFLHVGAIAESVDIAARLAAHVGGTILGYSGQWSAGLVVSGLKGMHPLERRPGRPVKFGASQRPGHPFPRAVYEQTVRVTTTELIDAAPKVVVGLTAGLARTMGVMEATNVYDDPTSLTNG